MSRLGIISLLGASLLLAWVRPAGAFGKNKIRHQPFHWRLHRTAHLDLYYYAEASAAVPWVARFAEEAYGRISMDLGLRQPSDGDRRRPLPVILFQNRRHFEQTTIVPGFIGEGVRGFSEQRRGRMVIPLEGPRRELEELIVHEMTHLLTYRAIRPSRLEPLATALPLWFMEGLAEHETGTWAAWDEATLRDAVLRGQLVPLSRLDTFESLAQPFLGYAIGHAAVDFLVQIHGPGVLRQVLAEMRRDWGRKSLRRALYRATRQRLDTFEQEFHLHLLARYADLLRKPVTPDASIPWPSADSRASMSGPAISPAGELIACFTNERGPLEIAVKRLRDGRRFATVASADRRYEGLSTDGRPLAWSPDGTSLAFIASEGGRDLLVLWDLALGAPRQRIGLGLDRAYSVAYHPRGDALVVGGMSGNRADLFRLDLRTRRTTGLTDDEFFDTEPAWSRDGARVAYSSERAGRWSLVLLDAATASQRVLLNGGGVPYSPAWSSDGERLIVVWDRDGIENLYELDPTTGKAWRLTSTLGRAASPCPLADGRLLYGEYSAGRFGLRLLPAGAKRPETIQISEPGNAFRIDLDAPPPVLDAQPPGWRLGLSQLGWGAALTEDQRVLAAASVSFSDLLAERHFTLRLGLDALLEEVAASFSRLSRRVEMTFQAGHRRRNVFFRGDRQHQTDDWVEAEAVYAFDRELRLEGRAQLWHSSNSEPFGVYGIEGRTALGFEAALVGDYVRYASFGPLSGTRFRLQAEATAPVRGWLDQRTLSGEVRHYRRLFRRWVVASRLATAVSLGPDPEYFSLGGTETIPGLKLHELTGENHVLANLEIRFPLVDYLGFGTGWSVRQLRGSLFAAAGSAFDDFEALDLWDRRPLRLKDLKASIGAQASVRLSRMYLRLTAAWPTDLESIADSPVLTFTIASLPSF